MNDYRILLVGYRSELAAVLAARKIPFYIWDPRKLKLSIDCLGVTIASTTAKEEFLRQQAKALLAFGPFTHCIAGTESGVYAASIARRILGSRLSKNTIILRCYDKWLMKEELHRFSIPMTDLIPLDYSMTSDAIYARLGERVVVKNRRSAGGKGTLVFDKNRHDTIHWRHGQIAERWIEGEEGSVESFIHEGTIIFTNVTEYFIKKHVNLVPASYSEEELEKILALNAKVISALKLRWGMTHLEFYRTKEGLLFGEIAVRPPGGFIMSLISYSYGFNPWEAYVAIELGEKFSFPSSHRSISSASMFHPGKGKVKTIQGWEEIDKCPFIVDHSLKIAVGDCVQERDSVSHIVAHIKMNGPTHATLLPYIRKFQEEIRFGVE